MSDTTILDPCCINHVQKEPKATRTYCSRCKGWQVLWLLDHTSGDEVAVADTIIQLLLGGMPGAAAVLAEKEFGPILDKERKRLERSEKR